MSLSATLKALAATGGTLDQAIAIVEAHEAAREAKDATRRQKDAARKAAQRVRDGHAESRGVTRTERDISDGPEGAAPAHTRSAQVVTPSLPSLRSEEVGGGGGEAREAVDDWPASKPTEAVRQLVEVTGSPWLDPAKSPGLVTTAGRLAAWKREGASWEHDVVPVVAAVCAKQRSPVATWKFFDQAIARSMADNRAALEIPDGRVVRLHATGPPGGLTAQIAAEKAEARRRVLEDG